MIKGVITLRGYYFCVAAICAAAVIGISGCAMNTKAESAQTQADASQPESAEAATVVEAVTGPIESMEETPNEELQPVRSQGSSSRASVQQEIICCSNRIKMVQKPRKIKVFRGFTISKWADIV